MSCCGDRRNNQRADMMRDDTLSGVNHETRVAYLWRRPVTVRGTFTGRRYRFSPTNRIRTVDSDDSRVMLRTRFFRRA